MNYELAKKLKEAGFPFKNPEPLIDRVFVIDKIVLKVPTLSELIEACGDDFRWLKARGHSTKRVWLAQGRPHPITAPDIRVIGSTPEEAVANLWLALLKDK